MEQLPPETRGMTVLMLKQVKTLDARIAQVEVRMEEVLAPAPEVELLRSLPGIGFTLATVIALEVGDVWRFSSPAQEQCPGSIKAGARFAKERYGTM